MALIITTWLWGTQYDEYYVTKLASAVKRNLKQSHEFIALVDRKRDMRGIRQIVVDDMSLTEIKGCFVRLQLFGPELQAACDIEPGDKVVNLDLDAVITGKLDDLFDRDDDFTILQGINTTNPCPYNGSIWMLKAGARPDVWTEFSPEAYAARGVPFHAFPDDQGWFHHMMPDAGAWGPKDGVYGFKKQGWPQIGDYLPDNAKLVAFPGWRDPWKFSHLNWVKQNWH